MAGREPHRRSSCALFGVLACAFSIAIASTPVSAQDPDRALIESLEEAEALIGRLEYAESRSLLEGARRDPSHAKAKRPTIARMWALLGRARAELGDWPGMTEAFEQAVRYDAQVRLAKSTSPKILAALERARLAAPVEAPSKPGGAKRKTPAPVASSKTKPVNPVTPAVPPTLGHRLEGRLVSRAKVRLVVVPKGLGPEVELEAHISTSASMGFVPRSMTRTGTVAVLELELDGPELLYFVEARAKKKTLARIGSLEAPIRHVVEQAPPISEAWAEGTKTATVASSTGAIALGAATLEEAPPLGRTEILILAGVGLLVVVGVTITALVLANRDEPCEADPGFGCTRIEVVPLMRF